MKGWQASTKSETEFVIVQGDGVNTHAWTAPRGPYARWKNGWTKDTSKAEIYTTWQAANAAIERYQKNERKGFANAKYCTFGEWVSLMRGEILQ